MASTQWGSAITYGWELEGSSQKIFNWYRKEAYTENQWANLNASEKTAIFNQARSSDPQHNWNHFVTLPSAPRYISDRLYQAVFDPTWEICCKEYPTTVSDLFDQMKSAYRALDGALSSFQIHIVFQRPPKHDMEV